MGNKTWISKKRDASILRPYLLLAFISAMATLSLRFNSMSGQCPMWLLILIVNLTTSVITYENPLSMSMKGSLDCVKEFGNTQLKCGWYC